MRRKRDATSGKSKARRRPWIPLGDSCYGLVKHLEVARVQARVVRTLRRPSQRAGSERCQSPQRRRPAATLRGYSSILTTLPAPPLLSSLAVAAAPTSRLHDAIPASLSRERQPGSPHQTTSILSPASRDRPGMEALHAVSDLISASTRLQCTGPSVDELDGTWIARRVELARRVLLTVQDDERWGYALTISASWFQVQRRSVTVVVDTAEFGEVRLGPWDDLPDVVLNPPQIGAGPRTPVVLRWKTPTGKLKSLTRVFRTSRIAPQRPSGRVWTSSRINTLGQCCVEFPLLPGSGTRGSRTGFRGLPLWLQRLARAGRRPGGSRS